MKKILIGLSIFTALSLQAADMNTNMKDMRDGLQEIQDGFLYNNKDGVLAGIDKVQKANKMYDSKKSVEAFLPKGKERMASVALLSAKNMDVDLEEMKLYVEAGQMLEASSVTADVIRSCTRCHAIVRGW